MTAKLVYWVDRSLGAHIVPKALSDHGINIRTYAEIYPNDDMVPDHVWIPEIAGRGWVILTKDKDIRREPVEIQALRHVKARYDCLSAGRMRGDEQAACFLEHWKTIDSLVTQKRAPLLVTVTRTHVQWLDGEAWRIAKRKR